MRDMHEKPRPKAVPASKPSIPASTRNVTISRGKKARPESKEPLKKRRKKTQKAFLVVIGIAILLLVIGLFYLAWMPAFRVSAVSAEGPHAEEAKQLAERSLEGTYAFILPRNSLFFIPEDDMRADILADHADIQAISITADGLNALRVRTLPRAEAFVWCGIAPGLADGTCYSANAEGLIFAPVALELASTSEALRVYGAIEGQEGASPVKAHIGYASRIPEALRFVKAMQTLGANVVSLSLRDDEADLYTEAGTRITYVLGHEQEAAGIAASVFPQLALNDGSVAYVDLRFSGKAYFKRSDGALPVGE
jgi:cell division septal protein FtsQ